MIHISDSFIARQDVIIAYELKGESLNEKLRLVLPGENGQSWISMITVISIGDTTFISLTSQAPYVDLDPLQNVKLPLTPEPLQPSAIPEPRRQITTQPTIPPTINVPVQQQNSSNSSSKVEYSYFEFLGIIAGVT
jgi:hypothetical protein